MKRVLQAAIPYVCIVYFQDKEGFIWIATEAGLSRFDGQRFTNFSTRDGLPRNDVFRLDEDTKGRIWIYSLGPPCFRKDDQFHILDFENDSRLQNLNLH